MSIVNRAYRMTAVTPLLMHNCRLADPMDSYTRQIRAINDRTRRGKKSDEDYIELRRLEFLGGLYLTDGGEPCIPARVVKGALGERSHRLCGVSKADMRSAVTVLNDVVFAYDGSDDMDELASTHSFSTTAVPSGQGRIVRTRPMFKKWHGDVSMEIDTDIVGADKFDAYFEAVGRRIGIGDWRPEFGRFAVEKV